MAGGGYILSGDLAEMLVSIHEKVGLMWSRQEDAAIGMWLAGLNIRRIMQRKMFYIQEEDCCFSEFPDLPWNQYIGHYRLTVDVCKLDPPRLILHAVRNITLMKSLGRRVLKCDFNNRDVLQDLPIL
eukprot:TRINITY_DN1385_c1_g2_i1.p2 TRINITY_DN1385_c1_g2~~TRINITY_DN1385_c1_g2_i1.p2  ORF type:complete len:142 (+),score=1.80 TRINITY_DN1385_c1_g2_i1:47-427(+)